MLDALQRRRPGHATVVAYLALFVALGGTGYATTVSNRTGKDAKRSVVPAKNPSQHGRGLLARAAVTTPTGAVAGAYGRVRSDGTLVQSRSSNVSSVSNPSPGVYCISLAFGSPAQSGLVVTPDYASDSSSFEVGGNHAIAEWRSDAAGCPTGRLAVLTGVHRSDGSLARRNQGFFFSVPAAPAIFTAQSFQKSLPHEHGQVPNPLAQLDLPPGSYSVAAKLNASRGRGDCRLRRPDINGLEVEYDSQGFDNDGTVVLQAVVTIGSPAALQLTCRRHIDPTVDAYNIKLTAIRIG